jgi:hypothetical protein
VIVTGWDPGAARIQNPSDPNVRTNMRWVVVVLLVTASVIKSLKERERRRMWLPPLPPTPLLVFSVIKFTLKHEMMLIVMVMMAIAGDTDKKGLTWPPPPHDIYLDNFLSFTCLILHFLPPLASTSNHHLHQHYMPHLILEKGRDMTRHTKELKTLSLNPSFPSSPAKKSLSKCIVRDSS